MEIEVYLAILRRRKWVIIITTAVTTAVVTIGSLLAVPQYEATTSIRVATSIEGSIDYTDYMYSDRLLNTYTEIITSEPILEELAVGMGRTEHPKVTVEILPNTELLNITVQDSDPLLAAEAANALAGIIIEKSQELYSGGGMSLQAILSDQITQFETELSLAREDYENLVADFPEDTGRIEAASRTIELKQQAYASLLQQYENARISEAIRSNTVSVVEPAAVPETPSQPRILLNIALGFLVGLFGGIGLAFSFEYQNKTLYTQQQIEAATTLPALGKIPTSKNWRDNPTNGTPFGESFRALRTQILASNPQRALNSLLITSAEVGEGKSVIAANLAFSLAQSGKKVIIVDADLRRPTLHRIFQLPNDLGLSTILKQYEKLPEGVQNSKAPGLKVLTSGPMLSKSTELLGSPQMSSIIRELGEWFDIILLDTPSLLAVTDAALLSPLVDGVVLVVGCGQTRERALKTAEERLNDIHAKLIGVVINRAEQDGRYAYYQDLPNW